MWQVSFFKALHGLSSVYMYFAYNRLPLAYLKLGKTPRKHMLNKWDLIMEKEEKIRQYWL